MQGLCGKWEPHLYCLLSSEHVVGPMHSSSCSLNSVDSSSAKPGSFLLQRKHLVPSHKRETQNLLLFDKHLGGHVEGTASQSSPAITKAHVLQRSLFRVLVYQKNLDPALRELVCRKLQYFCPNPGLQQRAEMRWSLYTHTCTQHTCLLDAQGVSVEERHWKETSSKRGKESSARTGVENSMKPTRERGKRKMGDTVNNLPHYLLPLLSAILFREDNVTNPG